MTAEDYEALVAYAGRHLARPHPWPVPACIPFPLDPRAAVYVAEDNQGRCRNVGSVARGPSSGLAGRIAEHLSDPAKRAVWHWIWVLPLHPNTMEAEVRRLEGVVGLHLGPLDNCWLPRAAPPPEGGRRFRPPDCGEREEMW